ncbi:MAG: hypothetical protein M1822_002581 [Bathelium mastoideum]|nr:MAG: hypothetical protein M1822_002581 [Bathelium mastoideum]
MATKSLQSSWVKAALVAGLASTAQARPMIGSSFGVPGYDNNYDYVVVGGGNAGLAVAERLVEQNAGTVAVLEAGTYYELGNGNISSLPGDDGFYSGSGVTDYQPLVDWGYDTVPQAGRFNKTVHYARGKCLGGSSARNFMVYQRGTVGSYQNWADQVGDDSYTWENFLPWFKKSVNFTEPNMDARFKNSTPVYVAQDAGDQLGPLSVTYSNYAQAFATYAAEGFPQMGIETIDGFLSGKLIGSSYATFTINATYQTRDSSETSFLRVGLENPNLIVYPLAVAKKINFDSNKKATGVLVETDGFQYTVSANKEVILSAGVFGTPQLLMVSGVGPAETLNSLNIPVVADRPGVGQGMQDHVFFDIAYEVDAVTATSLQNPEFAAEQAALFDTKAEGLYANPVTDVLGWEKIPDNLRANWSEESKTALAAYPSDWPEVEFLSSGAFLGDMISLPIETKGDANYASMALALVTPRSRGTVSIKSNDTNDAPLIDPKWLTVQSDVDIVVAGFKRIRDFWNTKALQSLVVGEEFFPGKSVQTDEEIEDFVRNNFNTIWHGTSTASMGRANDTNAVVDTEGRVIGVDSLRVIDASAMPLLPPGHPMSTIYALAEKLTCAVSGKC